MSWIRKKYPFTQPIDNFGQVPTKFISKSRHREHKKDAIIYFLKSCLGVGAYYTTSRQKSGDMMLQFHKKVSSTRW